MERLNAAMVPAPVRPVKVLQFGEGNFLRAFVDYMIDIANEKSDFNGSVALVKPIQMGTLFPAFKEQDYRYTVMLRGLVDGQAVKLRLLEPMQAGNIVVPKNTLVAGTAKVQGERLDILVSSIEYAGNIIPVELAVFDTDGQKGLSVPSSMEQEAFNEAMANIGSGLGTSISFAQSAGQQVAMDVTRGLLQGTSGYLAKKFRTVKVKLKAGYKVMLYAKQQ